MIKKSGPAAMYCIVDRQCLSHCVAILDASRLILSQVWSIKTTQPRSSCPMGAFQASGQGDRQGAVSRTPLKRSHTALCIELVTTHVFCNLQPVSGPAVPAKLQKSQSVFCAEGQTMQTCADPDACWSSGTGCFSMSLVALKAWKRCGGGSCRILIAEPWIPRSQACLLQRQLSGALNQQPLGGPMTTTTQREKSC